MKVLVTYFSAEGTTARMAEALAKNIGADIFEITPEKPYTKADINYMNPASRCNKEMRGGLDVPVSGEVKNFGDYDFVFVGFPIWYGCAPNVVNTFCKGYDWTGKKIGVFATSGGSGIGKSGDKLKPYVSGGEIKDAKCVRSESELTGWAEKLIK